MGVALARLSLSTSMRVIMRVHGQPTGVWATAQPPGPARLADRDRSVILIPHLSNRRITSYRNLPNLS